MISVQSWVCLGLGPAFSRSSSWVMRLVTTSLSVRPLDCAYSLRASSRYGGIPWTCRPRVPTRIWLAIACLPLLAGHLQPVAYGLGCSSSERYAALDCPCLEGIKHSHRQIQLQLRDARLSLVRHCMVLLGCITTLNC